MLCTESRQDRFF